MIPPEPLRRSLLTVPNLSLRHRRGLVRLTSQTPPPSLRLSPPLTRNLPRQMVRSPICPLSHRSLSERWSPHPFSPASSFHLLPDRRCLNRSHFSSKPLLMLWIRPFFPLLLSAVSSSHNSHLSHCCSSPSLNETNSRGVAEWNPPPPPPGLRPQTTSFHCAPLSLGTHSHLLAARLLDY